MNDLQLFPISDIGAYTRERLTWKFQEKLDRINGVPVFIYYTNQVFFFQIKNVINHIIFCEKSHFFIRFFFVLENIKPCCFLQRFPPYLVRTMSVPCSCRARQGLIPLVIYIISISQSRRKW